VRIYGKMEPSDLIPAHVYDRETGMLVWGLTCLAALDSLGLPLQWVVKGLGASTVVLGILASVVLRDTVANYFGGLIVIAAGWFSPKEVVRVLLSGRREISGRVEHIGLMYTKLINRGGGLYNSNTVTHSLKAPGFNPGGAYEEVKNWFQSFAFSNSTCTATPSRKGGVHSQQRHGGAQG
jgi:hypothetical protein